MEDAFNDSANAAELASVREDLAARLSVRGMAIEGDLRPFGDGHSGFSYALHLNEAGQTRECVLRLSPPGARIAGPADIGRQGRIMAALHDAGLPAPAVIDEDSTPVLDGRSFALMELVEGHSWEHALQSGSDEQVAAAAVAALRSVQSLPLDRAPIEEGPQSPVDEVERWKPLADRAASIVAGREGDLVAGLIAKAPAPSAQPVLVHGDFHYGNLIFGSDARVAEVVAVVDWEIATAGEPLIDLGCLAVATIRRRYPGDPNPTGSIDIELERLVELYGAEPDAASWFVAASCFKYAAILAYNLDLHRRGKRIDPVYEELEETIGLLLVDGAAILEGGLSALGDTLDDTVKGV